MVNELLTIQDIQDFKIERRRIQLPKPENNKGNLIFLPYLTPEESVKAIRNTNRLFNRSSFWKMYFLEIIGILSSFSIKLFDIIILENVMRFWILLVKQIQLLNPLETLCSLKVKTVILISLITLIISLILEEVNIN